jgi:predicted O-linked N-acetylglucosamine transferase (SPINDLY family)
MTILRRFAGTAIEELPLAVTIDDVVKEAQSVGTQYRDSDRATLERALVELHQSGKFDHRFWKALSDYFWSNGPSDYSLLPSEFYLETQRDLNLFFRAGEIHWLRGGSEDNRVHYFEEAVRCGASTAREYLVVGNALMRLRRWDEAFKSYESGLILTPDDSELWRAFASTSVAARSAVNFKNSMEKHQPNIVDVIASLPAYELVYIVKLLKRENEDSIGKQVADLIIRELIQQDVSDALQRLMEYIDLSAALNEFKFRDRICKGMIDDWSIREGDEFLKAVFRVKLLKLFTFPLVFEKMIDDEQFVQNFCAECEKLTRDPIEMNEPIADIGRCAPWVPIYTRAVPHLYSDAALSIHDLCARVWPRLTWTAPHIQTKHDIANRKIKIGFTCLDFMPMISGLMGKLDAEKFETVFLRPDYPQPGGETGRNWVARADRTVELPTDSVYEIQEAIAREELDVIVAGPSLPGSIYPMMARLAPVQMVIIEPNWCDSFPNMDYYITWGAAEPSNVKAFHRNPVALMQHPPYWLEMPSQSDKPVASVVTALAGAPVHKRVYLCPTSPAKLHPAFDEVVRKVLLRDPDGIVVLLRMDNPWGDSVRYRMGQSLGSMAERVVYLPMLKQEEAHALLNSVDCVLDAYPLGGMSSSFVAAAVGTPTVSMPKEMPFGKWMSAIYNYIGVEELTAASSDEYAEIAYRLASNPEWREKKAAEIRAKGHMLIESEAAAVEFEAFILKAWQRHTEGLPPTDWVNDHWVTEIA